MEDFEKLSLISDLINAGNEETARTELIKVLNSVKKPYSPLLNHLLREVGLYPYIDIENANWNDQFIYEIFKVNIGNNSKVTLHREQGDVLKKLLNGENIILSAPTSFGKSFIIDALIAIKKPKTIMIIVPTISLMDEMRRRLTIKFISEYKIVTTLNENINGKTILIFPQERVSGYKEKLTCIDLLIVDEFYKVSKNFDNERSDILLKAIMEIDSISKQKYYLCPNINSINDISNNFFSRKMEFIQKLDFKTVITEIFDYSNQIIGSKEKKNILKKKKLKEIVSHFENKTPNTHTLVYAGSYDATIIIGNTLSAIINEKKSILLQKFSQWLIKNYSHDFPLAQYVLKGIGIHNGQLHRSLTQIQTYLFSDNTLGNNGLHYIISTSSLIQGVNTSAENIIFWQRKNGNSNLKSLDYKNLIGRSGRMFQYFIGKVYLLDKPIADKITNLELCFSDNIQADIDVNEYNDYLSNSKKEEIKTIQKKFADLLNVESFKKVLSENNFKTSNWNELLDVAYAIYNDKNEWKKIKFLNSKNSSDWDSPILTILFNSAVMKKKMIDFHVFSKYVINSSNNWKFPLNQQIKKMFDIGVSINDYFKFEKYMSYDFSSIVNDINILLKYLLPNENIDISTFSAKLSYAFLPPLVYYLEEYGLPRTLSKEISDFKIINFEEDIPVSDFLTKLKLLGSDTIISSLKWENSFNKEILEYFFRGI